MKKIGLVVNPVAGMGGRVGLKGTDGPDVLRKAKELGALPESPRRTAQALTVISKIRDQTEIITYPKEMGEDESRECGFSPITIGSIHSGETTSEDTRRAAREIEKLGVDLLLFAGGDGTARDICDAIGQRVTALGIPAGVKIHSAVYAVTPRQAGEVALMFLSEGSLTVRAAEVMDIDEEVFREGRVTARLYGYLRVPEEQRFVQGVKSGGFQVEREALEGMAEDVISNMEENCFYIFGPGTTVRTIVEKLGLKKTLLGVDVVLNKRLVASDVTERELSNLITGKKAKIVVTVIGGQGYIFGRGNQQLSPEVIKKVGREEVIVVATKEKLASLGGRPLLVDTGSEDVDQMLSGYVRVTTGFNEYAIYKVER